MDMIKQHIENILQDSIKIRKQLHQIPELKYDEFKTAELITTTLKSYGYEVKSGIAKTGIIAVLDTGKQGKTIALRADMDALPLEEPASHECRSQHAGRMHACGHDGHCATMLAVANVLFRIKDQLCGKVKFIFQPAEEGGKGSSAMIDAGVLNDPKVDEIYGYHNWPGLPEGVVATRQGTILAGNGRVEITIHGITAHTAQPQNAINPVVIAAGLITALDDYRRSLSSKSALINIISCNSGNFLRGMAGEAKIIVVYYIDNDHELDTLKLNINDLCKNIADINNNEIDVTYHPFHSPTINSVRESDLVLNTAKQIYGDKKILALERSMVASEDFSEYLCHTRGCFFLVGAGESAGGVHTKDFVFNDQIISVAANVICNTVISTLMTSI